MWLAFYNKPALGDVLLLTSGPMDKDQVTVESKENVTLICDRETNQVVSINIFHASDLLDIQGQGQVILSQADEARINQLLNDLGCQLSISLDRDPKFVVGYVEECQAHEDSDHLNITQTQVGQERSQIVCGASNITAGLKVMVAKPGAVMPSGAIIWPGELRGVKSDGMICSTRELGLESIEDLPGIWELDNSFEPGTPLEDVVKAYQS